MVRKEMTRAVYFRNQRQKVESDITFTPEKRFLEARRHPAKACLQTCTGTTRHSGGALLFDSQPAQLGK